MWTDFAIDAPEETAEAKSAFVNAVSATVLI